MRLFIAVLPDENVRSALTDAQDALRMHQFTGRYVSDWDLHMTLTFIGEYPDANYVLETMANVPFPPMTLTLGGYIGNFDDLLWAGADCDLVLAQYVKSLRHVLADQRSCCCSAMWTFEYEEDYSGEALRITNHEIDIEFPGRYQNDAFSHSHALCTTWQTEEDYKTKSVGCGNQADGAFHTYRFDWHTSSETEMPRVEYYFDDVLTYTAYDFIPTNESRLWLGLWFPKNWAGTVTEIAGGFFHAMNGSFGHSPEQFTFMAIDRAADEWDI